MSRKSLWPILTLIAFIALPLILGLLGRSGVYVAIMVAIVLGRKHIRETALISRSLVSSGDSFGRLIVRATGDFFASFSAYAYIEIAVNTYIFEWYAAGRDMPSVICPAVKNIGPIRLDEIQPTELRTYNMAGN